MSDKPVKTYDIVGTSVLNVNPDDPKHKRVVYMKFESNLSLDEAKKVRRESYKGASIVSHKTDVITVL